MDRLEKLRKKQSVRRAIDALEQCDFDCDNCDKIYQERLEELQREYEKYA